jgi:hypothetical protein
MGVSTLVPLSCQKAHTMMVDLVNVTTRDGIRLDGTWRKPPLDSMTFATIPGADHAYTHQRDYVWGMVSQWLEKV